MREITVRQWLEAMFDAAFYLGVSAIVMSLVIIVSGVFAVSLS